jgi:hypothetical protein
MSWTVACFCGNIYTAPPDRCDACGSTLDDAAPRDASTRRTATAADVHGFAGGAVTEAGLRAHAVHSLRG